MDSKDILENLISGDPEKVISASYTLIRNCNNSNLIIPLIKHLPEIKKKLKKTKI